MRAADAESARREEQQRWRASLLGDVDGQPRFAAALARAVEKDDWPTISAMADTLPDWPLRRDLHSALAHAEQVHRAIAVAGVAGVSAQICEMFRRSQWEQETSLWSILTRSAIVGQRLAPHTEWRRVERGLRADLEANRREIERVVGRMAKAVEKLSQMTVWADAERERQAGYALDAAIESVDRIKQLRRKK